jgi:polyisoprenoid-binding protein YceI
MTFRAQGVAPNKGGGWRADGDLTVRGNTCPIMLDLRLAKHRDGSIEVWATGTLRAIQFSVKTKRRILRDKVDVKVVARLRRDPQRSS